MIFAAPLTFRAALALLLRLMVFKLTRWAR